MNITLEHAHELARKRGFRHSLRTFRRYAAVSACVPNAFPLRPKSYPVGQIQRLFNNLGLGAIYVHHVTKRRGTPKLRVVKGSRVLTVAEAKG
jgi:hypothetical protein